VLLVAREGVRRVVFSSRPFTAQADTVRQMEHSPPEPISTYSVARLAGALLPELQPRVRVVRDRHAALTAAREPLGCGPVVGR
jgi:hypothetical protein